MRWLGKLSEEVTMKLTPGNLGGCPRRENGGIRELRGEFMWSRTKSRPVWLGEGRLRRSWGKAGARGCRALKSMEGLRIRHWVPKEGRINFDFTNSNLSVGWRTEWIGAKVEVRGGAVMRPCSGEKGKLGPRWLHWGWRIMKRFGVCVGSWMLVIEKRGK